MAIPMALRSAAVFALAPALVCPAWGWINDETLRAETLAAVPGSVKRLQVDLDLEPLHRWDFLSHEPGFEAYHSEVTQYLEKYIPAHLLPMVDDITKHMEKAYYADYAQEMQSLSSALNISLGEIVLVNLVYQVEQIGTACNKVNTTGPCPPAAPAGPGLCSGLVADAGDALWQGRNLDWDLDKALLPFVVEVDYLSKGQTVFRGVQVVGMIGVLHGMAMGKFSVQINARDRGGSLAKNLLEELLLGGKTPTHVIRKALEQEATFSDAEQFLSSERLANPVYFILSGVQHGEGAILTRQRQRCDAWHLFETNPKDSKQVNPQPGWFRLQTNYDPWEQVPKYDDRRTPGVRNTEKFCKGGASVNEDTVLSVMTAWPTKNHHTDITSVMCARTGQMKTMLWMKTTSPHLMGSDRFEYTVVGSMLELYCNAVVDLLSKGNPSQSKAKLNIRQEKNGNVAVEGLTEEECKNADELTNLLERGNEQRTVAATAMNSESSRSHLILIIKIISVNKETKEVLKGKMLMCDLAGSERLKRSEVTDHQQTEAIAINKSLTALGDVIEALTKGGKGVVPYRNHKLTLLMQDSLDVDLSISKGSGRIQDTPSPIFADLRAMPVTCGDCCCSKDCNGEECGCKCGESIATLGAFFIVAAAAFWIVGLLFGWNGPDTHFQSDLTYHQFNMFWFYLGFITVAFGVLYAIYARGGKAFAREPEAEEETPTEEKSALAAAPTPYVMLPAEP
ncbi:unnamed protein product [Cladocopium goreaui]|uniref:Kinesin-like protein n=1 Tax=Cladocopium goreaui TaxID=2562237 RepID=A0A9P1GPK7_9DINO|nr:unnamed protein product [Cladocopium goreaui]